WQCLLSQAGHVIAARGPFDDEGLRRHVERAPHARHRRRDGLGGERGGHGENRRAGAGEGGPECARRARRGGDRVVAAHQRAAVRRVQHVVERRRKERRVGPRQAGARARVAAPDEPSPRPIGISDAASIMTPPGTLQPAPRHAATKPANSQSRSDGTVTACNVPRRSTRTGAPSARSTRNVALSLRSIAIPTQSNPAPTLEVEPGTRTCTPGTVTSGPPPPAPPPASPAAR